MAKPFLEVRNLSCTLSGREILRGITFTLHAGEFVSLLGPNGAGKSTLLKCLMRIHPTATATRIHLNGRSLATFPQKELAQKIAYVPQVQPQPFAFSVRELIQMSRYAHLHPWETLRAEDRRWCDWALERTRLQNFANRSLQTLSGGELQRVWLAAALAQNAEMLLLDESVSQMDYRFQVEMAELLQTLHRQDGKTILLVTHDLNDATRDSEKILALKEGKLLFDESPQTFLEKTKLREVYGVDFSLFPVPKRACPLVFPTFGKNSPRG
ncbi:MAG: ABC transporter ATP-binding protein [Planctomycetia bacterium]|nr:ABC transporter ATP-binding protein [Planctomycetia bacterium]